MSMLKVEGDPRSSCGYHRIVLPFSKLKATPKVPVFVFNRVPQCAPRGLEQMRRDGWKIIADIDDYWNLPKSHYLYNRYSAEMTSIRIRMSIERADVVMTTNATLAAAIVGVNPNVVIVPNALPFDEGQFKRAPGDRWGRSLFVYAAGASHADDIIAFKNAFNEPTVTIAGVQDGHEEWERCLSAIPQAKRKPVRGVESYMRVYDGHRVALAPLLDGFFNGCKSNLKTLEAGAMFMPIIASRMHPYENDQDRREVMLAENVDDWQRHMDRCRRDATYVREAGLALGLHVRRHYQLSAANEIRRQIIEGFS